MTTNKVVWVFDVKKLAYELSGIFAKVGVPQADNDPAILLKFFTKTFFLIKILIETYYTVETNYLFKLSSLYQCKQCGKTCKKICMDDFDPFSRSRRFKFSAVQVLESNIQINVYMY